MAKVVFNRQIKLKRVISPGDTGANREPSACVALLIRQQGFSYAEKCGK